MSAEISSGIEVASGRSLDHELKSIVVSVDQLLKDNRSSEAQVLLNRWEDNRWHGRLTAAELCGDARSRIQGITTAQVNSLGVSGPKEPYEDFFADRGIGAIVMVSHKGCGAAAAKENGVSGARGLEGFIEKLASSDPGILALVSARTVARKTEKPVAAIIQDHTTGGLEPIYVYKKFGKHRYAEKSDIWDMIEHEASREEIQSYLYEESPALDPDELREFSPKLAAFIDGHNKYAAELRRRYPDYSDALQTQNPVALAISTDVRSMSLKFPETFGAPGSLFNLRVPREKIDGEIIVDPELFEVVLDQATYPLTNPYFDRLRTILIETGSLALSQRLAQDLLARTYMQTWLAPGKEILVAESVAGRVQQIEVFNPQP